MKKICRSCLVEKTLEEFHKHPQMTDGTINKCRLCVNAYARARQRERYKNKTSAYDNKVTGIGNRKKQTIKARIIAKYGEDVAELLAQDQTEYINIDRELNGY